MLITIAVVIGFKQEIRNKVIGFDGHIQIVNFDNNSTYQMKPIAVTEDDIYLLQHIEYVESVRPFCSKPAIIKTDSAFQGVVLKGCIFTDSNGNNDNNQTSFFQRNLIEGRMPTFGDEVIVSALQCRQLGLRCGDRFLCYFIDDNVRARRYTIVGVYDTQFSDYDKLFVIGSIDEVRTLGNWSEDMVSGLEITISDFSRLSQVADDVYYATANRADKDDNFWYTQTIIELNPTIFSWLDLLDMNVIVIIILMLCVSGMCIISGLIILILDNIRMIGILKAIGADNHLLRQTFFYEASFLVVKGLLWGNLIALVLILLQYYTHVIPLDPTSYYVSYVPVHLSVWAWMMLNVGTIAVTLLIIIMPTVIVSRISPARVMHFE